MLPASWFKFSQPLLELFWIRVSVVSSLHQSPIESHQGDLGTAVDIQITSAASGWSSLALPCPFFAEPQKRKRFRSSSNPVATPDACKDDVGVRGYRQAILGMTCTHPHKYRASGYFNINGPPPSLPFEDDIVRFSVLRRGESYGAPPLPQLFNRRDCRSPHRFHITNGAKIPLGGRKICMPQDYLADNLDRYSRPGGVRSCMSPEIVGP